MTILSTSAGDEASTATVVATTPMKAPAFTEEPTAVADLIGEAQQSVQDAEAAAAHLAAQRRPLATRRNVLARREAELSAAASRAQETADVIQLDLNVLPDSAERYLERLRDEAGALASWLAALNAELAAVRAERADVDAQDGRLAAEQEEAQARLAAAQAALAQARHVQPLHDLAGVLADTLHGPLVLVDAIVESSGACTCWLADGDEPPNYLRSPGRLWRVSDYAAYKRLYPDLPAEWLERRTRLEYARLTVPSDGLLSAPDARAVLERLARPCNYRLVSIHHCQRDLHGEDRYVVMACCGAQTVALDTAGMARQLLGD
jgi:hypothetical protein